MNRLIKYYLIVVLSLGALGLSSVALGAVSATDNEIAIQQTGGTFKLTVDQIGYGNKLCGTLNSNICATDWIVTGTTLVINIDQVGNSNQLFGPTILDTSTIDLVFTGSSNVWDWNIGKVGSADDADIDVGVTGSSNTMDLDIGYTAAASSLNFDLVVAGGTNVFDVDIDNISVKWDYDVDGAGNNINTTQKGGADGIMTVELDGDDNDWDFIQEDGANQKLLIDFTGDDGDWDITQKSGTCPSGVSSCYGTIDLDVTSDDTIITIMQKDTAD